MTRKEAREILVLYRGEADSSLDGMAEALALLQTDPELKRWFDEAQLLRAQTRAALRSVEPPAGLRSAILRDRKVVKVPSWTRRHFLTGLAASLAIAAGGALLMTVQHQQAHLTLENFERRMLGNAIRSYRMDIETDDPKAIRELLLKRNVPAAFSLPPNLQSLPVMGGAALIWQDRPVAMVCFKVNQEIGYLFVIEEKNIPAPNELQRLGSYADHSTAVWRQGGMIYLLGAKVPMEELKKLIAG